MSCNSLACLCGWPSDIKSFSPKNPSPSASICQASVVCFRSRDWVHARMPLRKACRCLWDLSRLTLTSAHFMHLPPGHGAVGTFRSTWKTLATVSQLFVSRARTASTCFYCNSMSDDRTRIEGRTVGCLTCFWLSLPALDQPSTTNTDTCSERPCAHTFVAHFAEIAVRSHPSIA